ncbi:hypothetical protein CWE08_00645 [Aliidiomarina iranensis]|uniref:Flagellin N-terminal domain-containing protein n=1 Tax=Aliidiomarina iranensis TaxID=1434071 RepID=A0A432W246_9GAMM|nr:flagellar hook-associated protein FlgL [Aliidiomarina iranensis]RUO23196.1 hypothetical protein CWE08_00645 [Aliidiomarina iranensis]
MRISTVTIFDQNVSSMNRQQAEFMKVGQQLATGRRVVTPSDDPQAASRAVGVNQSIAVTQQYTDARINARNSISQQESVLNSVNDMLTRAKTLMIQASNGTVSEVDAVSISAEMEGIYEAMIGLGNTTDGTGRYIFGGYRDGEPPFARAADGTVEFVGSTQMREERVDSDRLLKVGHTGADVFLTGLSTAKPAVDGSPAETNLFASFEKAISALRADKTALPDDQRKDIYSNVMREFDNAQDNTLTKRASLGARLNELDTLDLVASNRKLGYEQQLSDLVDLDYAQAASDYSLRMVGLQAAQKSFVDIKGLSLFNYIR